MSGWAWTSTSVPPQFEYLGKALGMIIMAVAKKHPADAFQILSKGQGIVDKESTTSRVKKVVCLWGLDIC